MTYKIVTSKDGKQKGIKCLDCGLTSWHYRDVEEKYCGNCHEFHEQKERIKNMKKKYINPKTGRKYSYFNRKGEGYEDVLSWAKDMEPRYYPNEKAWAKYKIVKQEHIKLFGVIPTKLWLSTVWIGLDMSMNCDSDPLIFESMVFAQYKWWNESELEMDRYTTEAQAKAGHKRLAALWSNPAYILWNRIDRWTWSYQWKWQRFVQNWKNPMWRHEFFQNLSNLIFFALSVFTFVSWFFLPYHPWLRTWMSFGMGSMFVHSAFWLWKGRKAIKHEVWCQNRKECGEHDSR
jgi:hypothetical protein